ncbi:hypothetical protein [Burkholderia ubonensis]|uniref:hypothetical protein n=1 Tax=Burkholderia ubonensis TaxID=101571 RepID=UPI000F5B3DFD|nr:hypothetical protein [Burkholderia ubonensis]
MKLAHRHFPRCGNDENRLALAAHAPKADISNVVSPVGKIKIPGRRRRVAAPGSADESDETVVMQDAELQALA